jgi:ParB/RepB/Spo0J family partition protein
MTVQQRFAMVPLDQLTLGDNVRHTVGDVAELAESIRAQGILEPIVACPSADNTHVEVLMGQRRYTAAIEAGLTEVPCLLRPRPDDRDRVLMQLAENLEREPMSPIDEALAFQDLVELGISRRAIAQYVKRSESAIGKQIKLLDLPDVVRVALDVGWITVTVAQEIPAPLYTDRDALDRLAPIIRGGDGSVRVWIRDEAKRRTEHNPRGRVVLKGVRVLNVTMEAYDLAKRRAEAAGIGLGEWTSAAVFAYAEAQAELDEDAA